MQARNNDPLEICTRLERLHDATHISNKRRRTVDLASYMVGNLIEADPGHVTGAERYRIFYGAVGEILQVMENPHHGRLRRLIAFAQDKANARKLKKAYAALQLPESRSSKISVAFRVVDHTSSTLAIFGEAVPVVTAVAVALAKIMELTKTVQVKKDKALELSKHVEDVTKWLFKNLDDIKNLSPEALANVRNDIQSLQSVLDDILSALQRLQKPARNRIKALLFAKDHKDELGQLQRKLDDALRAFSTNNDPVLRTDVSDVQATLAKLHSQPISLAVSQWHRAPHVIPGSSSPRRLLWDNIMHVRSEGISWNNKRRFPSFCF